MIVLEGSLRLEIRNVRGKGRGVFFKPLSCHGEWILAGKLFSSPVIVFPNGAASGLIHNYTFEWDDDTSAIALGIGSLFNHSYNPNVVYRMDRSNKAIKFIARRKIVSGEELTINYNFDPEDKSPVGFRVKGDR